MVIIIPTDAAISAIALLRSSVMRQTLRMLRRAVNANSPQRTEIPNKEPPNVQKRAGSPKRPSGTTRPTSNWPAAKKKVPFSAVKKKIDRRVRATRDNLGDALIALMHEKPFETITVQHVLDRAKVSRSTFYAHYSDKNDLFLSDVEDFWEMMSTALMRGGDTSNRVAPVQELFSHVADMREFIASMTGSEKVRDVMELGQGHFARAIDERLATHHAARQTFPYPSLRISPRQRRFPLLSPQLVDAPRRLDHARPNGRPLPPNPLVRRIPSRPALDLNANRSPKINPANHSQTPLTGSRSLARSVPPSKAKGTAPGDIPVGN